LAKELGLEKVHDLVRLLKICSTKEPTLMELREACEFLNPFYIETRYPVHWPIHHTREEAENAQKFATLVGETVKRLLSRGGKS
ncbi:MAG: HEPN domain-containing protein, partial [Planctomycetes bacterium]|nr:HEPN domain-containing protein [Planctomycetota bacterium]